MKAEEAFHLLRSGERIRQQTWSGEFFWEIIDGELYCCSIISGDCQPMPRLSLAKDNWEVLTEEHELKYSKWRSSNWRGYRV